MRDGIKGWKNAGYATVGSPELLEDLIALNKNDFSASIISETEARELQNCCFVDFRDESSYSKGHIKHLKFSSER